MDRPQTQVFVRNIETAFTKAAVSPTASVLAAAATLDQPIPMDTSGGGDEWEEVEELRSGNLVPTPCRMS